MSLTKKDLVNYMMINFNKSITNTIIVTNNTTNQINELLDNIQYLLSIDNIGKTITITCDSTTNLSYTPIINGYIMHNVTLPTSNESITVSVYTDIAELISNMQTLYTLLSINFPSSIFGIETQRVYSIGTLPFPEDTVIKNRLVPTTEYYGLFLQGILGESNYDLTSDGLYNFLNELVINYNNENIIPDPRILLFKSTMEELITLKYNFTNIQNLLLSVEYI
jgi:hypothetical protein